jgi:hypothetical protein
MKPAPSSGTPAEFFFSTPFISLVTSSMSSLPWASNASLVALKVIRGLLSDAWPEWLRKSLAFRARISTLM